MSQKMDLCDIPEQSHYNSPLIDDFYQRELLFKDLVITGKVNMGREVPA